MAICHCNPYGSENDWTDSTLATVGAYYEYNGAEFMCVRNAGSGAGVAGELVGLFITTPAVGDMTAVSTEWIDGQLATMNPALGMLTYASTAGRYCYILTDGWTTTNGGASGTAFLKTGGSVVKGDCLVPTGGASPDGTARSGVAGEEHVVFGTAIADDTAGALVIAKVRFQ